MLKTICKFSLNYNAKYYSASTQKKNQKRDTRRNGCTKDWQKILILFYSLKEMNDFNSYPFFTNIKWVGAVYSLQNAKRFIKKQLSWLQTKWSKQGAGNVWQQSVRSVFPI